VSIELAMSALSQKQTFAAQYAMSAFPCKADMCGAQAHVCYGPDADIAIWRLGYSSPAFRKPTTSLATLLGL
jgi:hypothetical protein